LPDLRLGIATLKLHGFVTTFLSLLLLSCLPDLNLGSFHDHMAQMICVHVSAALLHQLVQLLPCQAFPNTLGNLLLA
jgi:hypothetical protein